MLASAAKLALVTAAVAVFATSADAEGIHRADTQGIHPNCAKILPKMKDKVKCTCFFANGGIVQRRPDGVWTGSLYSMGQADGYIACLKRHGHPDARAAGLTPE